MLRAPARRQINREAVHDATAIRVDQPAQERLWMGVDKRTLPRGKNDRSRVLPAWPMLREELRSVLPPALDDLSASAPSHPHGPVRRRDFPDG